MCVELAILSSPIRIYRYIDLATGIDVELATLSSPIRNMAIVPGTSNIL